MQHENHHGIKSPVEPFDQKKYDKLKENKKISKVEVFGEEEAKERRDLYNAKWRNRHLGVQNKRFNRRNFKPNFVQV